MLENIYERSHLEEQIRDAESRHQEALDQIDVVDKQIRDLEVKVVVVIRLTLFQILENFTKASS